ncbi:MAG: UDP-N-acetylmuramoyl-L-alanyl-D-glutamate--2,6-diaminopimelate ligase [Armatimonadota bacterium]|nr:MAG: UDP-N-acetylmuramoyl-L-alanyl-D-glutamate--2,6-diaminopimelate ligase [Armatimonadota bacterium]
MLKSVPGARAVGNPQVAVTGLAYDSRQVQPGWAFLCVRGSKTDGHAFIPEAIDRGAVALVLEAGREASTEPPPGGALAVVPNSRVAMAAVARAFHGDPSSRLRLAGVTGTNGKTTTALIMDAIFRAARYQSGLIGTLEYRIGQERMKPLHTTPEAVDLQRLLAALVARGATHAAMEVSSHALSLRRVDGCQFAAAVFTNLTPEHLDFHSNMDDYLEAKRRLFEDPQYLPHEGERVNAINTDDEAGRTIAAKALGRTLSFGLAGDADCRAEQIELAPTETRFLALLPSGARPVRMQLVGRFNVYNALAALAACLGLGIPADAACSALAEIPPVRGRFERVPAKTHTVLVDYAHSPDGIRRALETARQISRGRVIVVFGCGGDRDRTKRPVMGGIASGLADLCVVTSDNPRSEKPEAIIEQIVVGIPAEHRDRCSVEPDRAKAIRMAIEEASADDLVLIAGKGHEDYQIFADRTIHFDDREAAEAVLREIEGDLDA